MNSSRRRHTRFKCDWSSDVCSSDLPESIQKIKDAKKGTTFTEEHRKKLSESHKGTRTGADNHFFGKSHSKEALAKMSGSLTGKVRTDEFKQNLSEYWKGKKKGPMSEETKRKISETKRRKQNDTKID